MYRNVVTSNIRISFPPISMYSNISNISDVWNISRDCILLLAAHTYFNEYWIQCRSGNRTSLLLLKLSVLSFIYPWKKFLLSVDMLLQDNEKVVRQHFNAQSSGSNCSLLSFKLRVDSCLRLQNAPTSICSKPIADRLRSCNMKWKYETRGLSVITSSPFTNMD